MKRSYREVALAEGPRGYGVRLDARVLATPAGRPLDDLPRPLAEALAEEWRSQGEEIRPHAMPIMRLVATARDRFETHREGVIEEIVGYGSTDLLCHRASQPAELARRQQASWQPVLDWLALTHDVPLNPTVGVMPHRQSPAALSALRRAVEGLDAMELAGLHALTAGLGSVALALAVFNGRLDDAAAWEAAQVDEAFQIERWGDDEEARGRREGLRRDVENSARFLALCRTAV